MTFGTPITDLPTHVSTYGTQPWERQPHEEDEDWAAFQAYRESGYPQGYDQPFRARSLKELAATLGRHTGWATSRAASYAWTERAGAFDRMLDVRKTEAGMTSIARTNYQHQRMLDKTRTICEQQIDLLLAKSTSGEELSVRELTALNEWQFKYDRLTTGQSTENVSVKHDIVLTRLTDDLFETRQGETEFQVFERLARKALGECVSQA